MEHRLKSHQFVPRHERINRGVLQGHTDNPSDSGGRLLYVVTVDSRSTPGGSKQGGEHPNGGRLACTVGSQKSKDLTTGNGQVDSFDSDDLTEGSLEATCLDHDVVSHSYPVFSSIRGPSYSLNPTPMPDERRSIERSRNISLKSHLLYRLIRSHRVALG